MRAFGSYALTASLSLTAIATAQVELSEIRISQAGPDTDRFVEISGPVGFIVDGYSLIVIGDLEGAFPPEQNGGVEMIVDLTGTIGKTGVFIVAESSFSQGSADQTASTPFELGDNLTILLVDGFTGNIDDDIDTDNDGVIDNPLWSMVMDSVALVEEANPNGSNSEFYYSDDVVGPVNNLPPSHAWQCSDNGVWRAGQDSLGGANEDPGMTNATCGGVNKHSLSLRDLGSFYQGVPGRYGDQG